VLYPTNRDWQISIRFLQQQKMNLKKIDILVLNAGIYSIALFEMVSESVYDSVTGTGRPWPNQHSTL
jgi:NADP-dependent 3-hydroxy acid dehydrogenase YdfG